MKMRIFSLILTLVAGIGLSASASNGDLIVFLSQADHPVSKDMRERYVPKLKIMAESQGIGFKLVELSDKSPDWISYTPAIVFQNHLGRSLYVGRYQYVDKVKTFIRTVKRMPQQQVQNEKHDVLVWENERATLITPVKITDLSGTLPKNFNQAQFKQEALAALDKGMSRYKLHGHFMAERNDRLIYTAFYPYRSEDGKLFLSTEMYSQFNCIEPIYKRFDNPFSGSWSSWQKTFAAAGAEVEQEIIRQLADTTHGDGLIPMPSTEPIAWEALGLALPPAPEGAAGRQDALKVSLAQRWSVAGPVESDIPVVGFAFPAPLDYYAGELSELKGDLNLGAGGDMGGASGQFSVNMSSLSMGDIALDNSVHKMLKVLENPQSSFLFKRMKSIENAKLAFGMLTQFIVEGEFEFMGIKAPVDVTAQMEPVLDDAGQQALQVYAVFQIRLQERYGVKGPDGPEPVRDTVLFSLNFLLHPAA